MKVYLFLLPRKTISLSPFQTNMALCLNKEHMVMQCFSKTNKELRSDESDSALPPCISNAKQSQHDSKTLLCSNLQYPREQENSVQDIKMVSSGDCIAQN